MKLSPEPPPDKRKLAPALELWLEKLSARHLADLSFPEVRRGLQALSSLYVERRGRLGSGAALDGRGKRAAFALYYGPLHFLAVGAVVEALGAATPPPTTLVDLGCGTGAAGAAWAVAAGGTAKLEGVDKSPWAAAEARWSYQILGLNGRAHSGDVGLTRLPGAGGAIVAAYTVNELPEEVRKALLPRLLVAHRQGARVLIVEPIAQRQLGWWPAWQEAFLSAGGRGDEWRFALALPERVLALGRAAGLRPAKLAARSLWLPGGPA